jgi:6-phosphogluconolactonase (cycloisomerase 2 family)
MSDYRVTAYRTTWGLSWIASYSSQGAPYFLSSPAHVTLSPDGAHLYIASWANGIVSTWTRNATSGALAIAGTTSVVQYPNEVVISPDGAHAYVTGEYNDEVVAFARNSSTGALTFLQTLRDGIGGVQGIAAAEGVAISPDGATVYVTGPDDGTVAVFARNPGTGLLTYLEQHGGWLTDTTSVAVNPDGTQVYATGRASDSMVVFTRNTGTGRLTVREVHRDGLKGVDGLDDARNVVVSPDGAHVYVSARTDNSVAVFRVVGP